MFQNVFFLRFVVECSKMFFLLEKQAHIIALGIEIQDDRE